LYELSICAKAATGEAPRSTAKAQNTTLIDNRISTLASTIKAASPGRSWRSDQDRSLAAPRARKYRVGSASVGSELCHSRRKSLTSGSIFAGRDLKTAALPDGAEHDKCAYRFVQAW
jgi:hypothetical protein